jgi:hypothetical protein
MIAPRWLVGLLLTALLLWTGGSGDARACGPFFAHIVLTSSAFPADVPGFDRGEVGVIQPGYPRRLLVQAYRRLTGAAPEGPDPIPLRDAVHAEGDSALRQWQQALDLVATDRSPWQSPPTQERRLADYQYFLNCPDDALITAAKTLRARLVEFGAASTALRQWVDAQVAVFSNCDGDPSTPVVLPEAAPPGSDPLQSADRRYQIAAAHFYGTHYELAEVHFRSISEDPTSPWRIWGRYLADRALIRRALVASTDEAETALLLRRADADLAAVIADPSLLALPDRSFAGPLSSCSPRQ